MTVVVDGDNRVVEQVVKQLNKLINVTEVLDVTDKPTVIRELALVKVKACAINRLDLWVRQGIPAYPVQFPHILGSDIAGEEGGRAVLEGKGQAALGLAVATRGVEVLGGHRFGEGGLLEAIELIQTGHCFPPFG
jgi:acetolactate synthase small subunit